MKLLVLLALLGLTGHSQAIHCYKCQSPRPIANVSAIGTALSLLINAPSCQQFDAGNPDWNKKFIQDCPDDQACLKVTDPRDATNEARGCFQLAREDTCKDGTCFCTEDLCNGAGRGWPSAALLLTAAIAAALLGARPNW